MSARGRRRDGGVDTRVEIVDAARELFSERGFDATSLRAVARRADVDPALVHHYFDGKVALFVTAMQVPFDPAAVLPTVVEGPRDELGHRLAELWVRVWEGEDRDRMLGLLRSATTNGAAATMLREFMAATLVSGLAERLDVDQPRLRASLCAATVVGMGVMRGIIEFAPLQEADTDELVEWLAPTLQRYLTGPAPTIGP